MLPKFLANLLWFETRCLKRSTFASLNSKFWAAYATDVKKSCLWKDIIYMWQFRSCVQCRGRCQAIIREDSWLQNASFKSCNLKLSRPEVLLPFVELICKWCWRWQLYVLQAANDLSVNWKWSLRTFGPQWLAIRQSGQVLWSNFDENRKGRNSESLFWWNHRRLYFDKGKKTVA